MAPYTPQQNGVVERRNRTVMAMARSLLKGTHMPAKLWGEAVRYVVYLLNRLSTKALGERTSFEAWMGRKSHLAHLRVFGCAAYVKNATPHLKNPNDRSSPMVYLGVEEGCKAHRLFNPRHDKLQVIRHVMFRENCEWTWNASANNEEKVPVFMVVDALGTDEVIVAANIEAIVEYVTTTTVAVEVVGIDEEEGEVMMVISEEPTCYQEAATEACWSLEELGFKKCTQEHAVYTRGEGEASILVGVYVDDLIVTKSSIEKINKFKQQMMTEFEMSDLGLFSYYLGIEVEQQKSRILLRQSAYAKKILSQFKMADCNATKHLMEPKTQLHKDFEGTPVDAIEYRRIIGCTIYFGLVYIKGSQEIGIFGYSDNDLAGDLDGRKITSGMTFYFNESLVSWNSQKQKTVALSSCEAEFMAAATAACHALWLRSLDSELTDVEPKPIVVEFVNIGEQRADALTKALPGVKLAVMRQPLCVRDL
ncbi:hypothetical protein ZIOFF_056272 [Zingiber officinale]|uniref:Integrase catalytic domain-containing protein n=1 Tax=Zingiber officinale TaxID=94328 RepID=A0A8J5FHX8_ZINOF|nr:hypothetical protein ZIOFF_056272 [Zingiber officinale]